jgi:glycosyltransferase involved in cell wall biosynthesis
MSSTVCLIAKNEERAIAEWLAYQKVIGFDRVLVYDNGSTDSTPEIVRQIAAQDPSIEYRAWPDKPGARPQITAYADAISKPETDWIAFFDTDEFLVLHKHPTVNAYLASIPADVSAIAVNWLIFGSNGRVEAGDGLVMNRFTKCAIPNYPKNAFCKSIVRPQNVNVMLAHTASLKAGRYSDASGNPVDIVNGAKTDHIDFATVQLNHYLLKSQEEFLLKKSRGNSARAPEEKDKWTGITDQEHYWAAHDTNHRDNFDVKPWCEKVINQMRAWGQTENASAA